MKVAAVQCRVGELESAERLIASTDGIDLFLLPEYFSLTGKDLIKESRETVEAIRCWSSEYSCIVAGNALEKRDGRIYNTLFIFDHGEFVGKQEKIHPTKVERNMGISRGEELRVFNVRGVRIAALICADILYPEICRVAGLKGVDIVLNPVVSFRKSELPAQQLRSCLYFTRSFDNAYAVIKAGGVGRTFTGVETIGRSLISTFEGIVASYTDEEAEEIVWAEIDVSLIRMYRRVNYSLQDRNVAAYAELCMPTKH
ncbi:carbon-nitrogen hydrolase family protein [Archaeoglobus veneficus]|uniref:Nitrilase/cyanide hydratase and apolipoprotein N-acyltransferase n=1 Tax=Archaeoglobus veneficus (strain DSM 11195 / SNP6) TaxID=693661 RepID=F2KT04_ARCVS|nr:carbon-nitrogen hydrolase family protein [Archaeoglobus veneficus]AEA47034.1 Nitrilase/cyanide hydratase and apolipoprotein N-acyltransferase [Archaeoglobus veneficus SNP6]